MLMICKKYKDCNFICDHKKVHEYQDNCCVELEKCGVCEDYFIHLVKEELKNVNDM